MLRIVLIKWAVDVPFFRGEREEGGGGGEDKSGDLPLAVDISR